MEEPGQVPKTEPPDEGRVDLRSLGQFVPLVAALIGAVVASWPAINSPFYSDDYIYLGASRNLSFSEYLRASLVPYSNAADLGLVTQFFWRPLYFLSFGVLEPLLGGNATGYHLLLLGIHLVSVGMVWLLAKQLTGRWEAAGIAAIVFAVHPAAFEGVAWISSLSNAGLPLMLGAWVLFIRATHDEPPKFRWLLCSAALFAIALGFRESTVAIVPAIAAWWLLCRRRGHLGDRGTYAPFVPFVAVGIAYALLRTRFLTEPATSDEVWSLGRHVPEQSWYYIKVAALPLTPGNGAVRGLQVLAGLFVLALLPFFIVRRRWLPAAIFIGFLFAVLPYAPLVLGVSPRYLYFPVAFLALALGAAGVELLDVGRARVSPAVFAGSFGIVGVVVFAAGVVSTHERTADWVVRGPNVEQAWVEELRASYPVLASGSTLYCANVPLILALFEDANLQPVVQFYYPGVMAERFELAELSRVQATLGPGDRIFIPAGTR